MTNDSIEAKVLALVNEICLEKGVIPYAKLPNIEASEALCRAIERHEALEAENKRLREHLISALDTLKDAEVCNDNCGPCNEAWAALQEQSK